MRRPAAIQLIALVASLLIPSAATPDGPRAELSVEFGADGKCAVKASGEGIHAEMTYTPPASARASGEFRCAVPPLPAGRAVDVQVLLAPGARPAGSGTPPLTWIEQEGRWRGSGSLDAAPEVIVVPDYFGPAAVRARTQWRMGFAGGGIVLAALVFLVARRRRS
ncbi:MAG TPA: hypothetical protein VH417_14090 [Vicinamibacterales bacterium]|jgi:hypothetical protein